MLIAEKLDRYRVSIKKENVPSKLIKQQTEDAINNAIQGWKETQTMLLQGDAVISPQPEKILSKDIRGLKSNQKNDSTDASSRSAQLDALSLRIQPVQRDNVVTGPREAEDFSKKKFKNKKEEVVDTVFNFYFLQLTLE